MSGIKSSQPLLSFPPLQIIVGLQTFQFISFCKMRELLLS